MTTTGYALGFRSLEEECTDASLPVEGRVPAWLDGALYRNGPAKFEAGGRRLAHWFDGLAMVRRFGFADGEVTYTNRFLRTEAYEDALAGRTTGEFGTVGAGDLLARVRATLVPEATDNANVAVHHEGDRLVAMTETTRWHELDPVTLETRGPASYEDDLPGQLTTAHPLYDPDRGVTVNYQTEFGRNCAYHVYRLPDGSRRRERIASVPVEKPAYMHSFGLTERHVVLAEFPLRLSPLSLLRPSTKSFIERFDWEPERGTRVRVLDRDRGEVVADTRIGACFCFHHVNAFDDGEEVVVDLSVYPDHSVVGALSLGELRERGYDVPPGELRRYRVPLDGGRPEPETVYTGGIELPVVSPAVAGRPYRYAYGQGPTTGDRPTTAVKVDTARGDVQTFADDGVYLGEPVFVPAPDAEREDEGVALTVGLDTAAGHSRLYVLDGQSFEERARADLPHHLPFDFHGQFYGRERLASASR